VSLARPAGYFSGVTASEGGFMNEKKASTDYPIHPLLADRWSPYVFANRPVDDADLRALFEAWTGPAIGYKADPASLSGSLGERDLTPRQRKPLREFVFGGKWETPSPLVLDK
jgi:hypothetical protein